MEYAEQRIPVLNEFCVVCDEPHVFQNGPMLRVSVQNMWLLYKPRNSQIADDSHHGILLIF